MADLIGSISPISPYVPAYPVSGSSPTDPSETDGTTTDPAESTTSDDATSETPAEDPATVDDGTYAVSDFGTGGEEAAPAGADEPAPDAWAETGYDPSYEAPPAEASADPEPQTVDDPQAEEIAYAETGEPVTDPATPSDDGVVFAEDWTDAGANPWTGPDPYGSDAEISEEAAAGAGEEWWNVEPAPETGEDVNAAPVDDGASFVTDPWMEPDPAWSDAEISGEVAAGAGDEWWTVEPEQEAADGVDAGEQPQETPSADETGEAADADPELSDSASGTADTAESATGSPPGLARPPVDPAMADAMAAEPGGSTPPARSLTEIITSQIANVVDLEEARDRKRVEEALAEKAKADALRLLSEDKPDSQPLVSGRADSLTPAPIAVRAYREF